MKLTRLSSLQPQLGQLAQPWASNAATAFGDPARPSASARGYGSAWRKLRAKVLQRDAGLCQPCKRGGRSVPASEVDHIVNKEQGGTDADTNLQAICKPCHAAKTAAEGKPHVRR